ncbi:MAG TPA: bacteriohemerythrin [Treponemataceae bacterium]|nr:bacteriohemerythrin [Treponemataceae bacterium]HQL04590.1 bacteriohemerythrin [Treponemataceae bacterium]
MELFEWSDSLKTGIESIDLQHKKLLSFVNELHAAMKNREAGKIIFRILKDLADYTDYHFKNEEKAFQKFSYPDAENHKKSHEYLIKQIHDLLQKQEAGDLALSVTTLGFLIDWVTNHIMKEDMSYVPFFAGKSAEFE